MYIRLFDDNSTVVLEYPAKVCPRKWDRIVDFDTGKIWEIYCVERSVEEGVLTYLVDCRVNDVSDEVMDDA